MPEVSCVLPRRKLDSGILAAPALMTRGRLREPSGRRLRPRCMFFDVLALIICVCAACLLYITAPDLD